MTARRRVLLARSRVLTVALLAVSLGGCTTTPVSSPATTPPSPSPIPSASGTRKSPVGSPSASATATRPSPAAGEFVNPVIDADFPDPDVIEVEGTYYAYATTNGTGNIEGTKNIQVARSDDLVHWEMLPDALPELPSWSGFATSFAGTPERATWAPDVERIGDTYVLYYSAPALKEREFQDAPPACVGRAISSTPAGPFRDTSSGPLVCEPAQGFTIDPAFFRDADGTPYLFWRQGCCGLPARIFVAELSEDGLELAGEPIDTGVRNDQPWEARTVESAAVVLHEGTYYLLYAGNSTLSYEYGVGYATSRTVTGPYSKPTDEPILVGAGRAAGPGHPGVFVNRDGDLWVAYHAWELGKVGYEFGGRRSMWIDELVMDGGTPRILGPDDGPQPTP